jgi:protein-S-isoprenylcysteine O-methyltransferase
MFTIAAGWAWLVLFLVWLPGYFTARRTARRLALEGQLPVTALLIIGFVLLFIPGFLGPPITPRDWQWGVAGLVLTVAGTGFAIWARLTIGRNWSGTVITLKVEHELVQRGPYAIVRHPIYFGLAVAMLGTALTKGVPSAYLGFVLGLIAYLIRVAMEERLMAGHFGATFEAYRRHTRKLVPFVW